MQPSIGMSYEQRPTGGYCQARNTLFLTRSPHRQANSLTANNLQPYFRQIPLFFQNIIEGSGKLYQDGLLLLIQPGGNPPQMLFGHGGAAAGRVCRGFPYMQKNTGTVAGFDGISIVFYENSQSVLGIDFPHLFRGVPVKRAYPVFLNNLVVILGIPVIDAFRHFGDVKIGNFQIGHFRFRGKSETGAQWKHACRAFAVSFRLVGHRTGTFLHSPSQPIPAHHNRDGFGISLPIAASLLPKKPV